MRAHIGQLCAVSIRVYVLMNGEMYLCCQDLENILRVHVETLDQILVICLNGNNVRRLLSSYSSGLGLDQTVSQIYNKCKND